MGHLVLIGGYAGTGKSTLGGALAARLGWTLIDKDTLTAPLTEQALAALGQHKEDRDSPVYRGLVRPLEYAAVMAVVAQNLAAGVSLIVAAPFVLELRDATWQQDLLGLCERTGTSLTTVWVHCDPATMRTRLLSRGAARDGGKLAAWDSYLEELDLDWRSDLPHTVVDTSVGGTPLTGQVERLAAALTTNTQG